MKAALLFIIFTFFTFLKSFSQDIQYSIISKNVNTAALSLNHNLNKTGDTLHLSNDFYNLYKVEFIAGERSKTFLFNNKTDKLDIPLMSIALGDYTVAVHQLEKADKNKPISNIILFRIFRLLPITNPSLENNSEVVETVTNESIRVEKETKTITPSKKTIPYNLSTLKKRGSSVESRESYRASHLRPNGLPYN